MYKKILNLIMACLLSANTCFAWGNNYRSNNSYSETAYSWKQYKEDNKIKTQQPKTFWQNTKEVLSNIWAGTKATINFIGNIFYKAFDVTRNFFKDVSTKVYNFFKPLETESKLTKGYFEIDGNKMRMTPDGKEKGEFGVFASSFNDAKEFARQTGQKDDNAYKPTLYNHDNGSVTVDMPLNWLNKDAGTDSYVRDAVNHKIQSNRWLNSVETASVDIARLIDSKHWKVIEVGGVNVVGGLGTEKLNQVLANLKIPENKTVVIAHSAGTHAATLAMSQIKRNQDEVFWILLSPRLAPQKTEKLIKQAGVKFDHVISINNKKDYAHCASFKDLNTEPTKHNPKGRYSPVDIFTGYNKVPWTHVWLKSGTNVILKKGRVDIKPIKMHHGTMYDNLVTNVTFEYSVNGKVSAQQKKVILIINEIIGKGCYEKKGI